MLLFSKSAGIKKNAERPNPKTRHNIKVCNTSYRFSLIILVNIKISRTGKNNTAIMLWVITSTAIEIERKKTIGRENGDANSFKTKYKISGKKMIDSKASVTRYKTLKNFWIILIKNSK